MSETIVVEAVSDKFKNKFNSGSVLAGGKWLQVAKKLDISDFVKDTTMVVETKTNDKGYTSIVDIVGEVAEKSVKSASKAKEVKTADAQAKPSYEENKNRRILVQGITQAVVQAPFISGLPYTTANEALEHVKLVARELIAFVEDESNG